MNEEKTKKLPFDVNQIFSIDSEDDFRELALEIFRFQYANNDLYQSFCKLLNRDSETVRKIEDIPFLPIRFFKTQSIRSFEGKAEISFRSSGTTGSQNSVHDVWESKLYEKSFTGGFKYFYGNPDEYLILGLLPSYLEQGNSSLVYMVDRLIELSQNAQSGFFLDDFDDLIKTVQRQKKDQKILLIGVSYALLDLAEKKPDGFEDIIVMETGGMKGRRKEMTRAELHQNLKKGLGVSMIHSEYGMTELLSQAYSSEKGQYRTPPWMSVMIRERTDPFSYITSGKSGGINVIDLANVFSCSFIATDDLGRRFGKTFEVVGRLENSDIRGCNLMID